MTRIVIKLAHNKAKEYKGRGSYYQVDLPFKGVIQEITGKSMISSDKVFAYPFCIDNVNSSYELTNYYINKLLKPECKKLNKNASYYSKTLPYKQLLRDIEYRRVKEELVTPNNEWYDKTRNDPNFIHHFDYVYEVSIRYHGHIFLPKLKTVTMKESSIEFDYSMGYDTYRSTFFFKTRERAEEAIKYLQEVGFVNKVQSEVNIHRRKGEIVGYVSVRIKHMKETFITREVFNNICHFYWTDFLYSKVFR